MIEKWKQAALNNVSVLKNRISHQILKYLLPWKDGCVSMGPGSISHKHCRKPVDFQIFLLGHSWLTLPGAALLFLTLKSQPLIIVLFFLKKVNQDLIIYLWNPFDKKKQKQKMEKVIYSPTCHEESPYALEMARVRVRTAGGHRFPIQWAWKNHRLLSM